MTPGGVSGASLAKSFAIFGCAAIIQASDVLGSVSNQETSKPKKWFPETKPNQGRGLELALVLVLV
jgi:hypothetical protein